MVKFFRSICPLVVLLLINAALSAQLLKPAADSVTPLIHAHAHNDYEHDRPLLDALEHGFTSIEADVFLVEEQLLVAHNLIDVSRERTLEKLYLQPLQQLASARTARSQIDSGGQHHRSPTPGGKGGHAAETRHDTVARRAAAWPGRAAGSGWTGELFRRRGP